MTSDGELKRADEDYNHAFKALIESRNAYCAALENFKAVQVALTDAIREASTSAMLRRQLTPVYLSSVPRNFWKGLLQ